MPEIDDNSTYTRAADSGERIPGKVLAATVVASVVFILAVIWLFALGVRGMTSAIIYRSEREGGVAPELQELRNYEDSVLHGYGWSQDDSGYARVPISRAVEILTGGGGQKP